MLIALLGLGIDEDLHVVNALKSAAVTTANAAAALIFAVVAELKWAVVCSSPSAGSSGDRSARLGRRLPAPVLRFVVVTLGPLVAVRLTLQQHLERRTPAASGAWCDVSRATWTSAPAVPQAGSPATCRLTS